MLSCSLALFLSFSLSLSLSEIFTIHILAETIMGALFIVRRTPWERWGAGVETQKNVRGEIRGWGLVPFNETYAPLLSTIYDGA